MTTNMSTKGMGKEGEEGKELPADVVPAEDGGVEHLAGGMPLTSRSYQLEMVEESMQKNIIVAYVNGFVFHLLVERKIAESFVLIDAHAFGAGWILEVGKR